MRQTILPAFLAAGPTFTEFAEARARRYQETGLGLLLLFIVGVETLRLTSDEGAPLIILELSSLTKELAAMAPHWNPLSLKCFTFCFDNFPRRTPHAIADELEQIFFECCP